MKKLFLLPLLLLLAALCGAGLSGISAAAGEPDAVGGETVSVRESADRSSDRLDAPVQPDEKPALDPTVLVQRLLPTVTVPSGAKYSRPVPRTPVLPAALVLPETESGTVARHALHGGTVVFVRVFLSDPLPVRAGPRC